MIGYNYRMTDIQGALGSAQMDRVDGILSRRRELAALFDQRLRELDWIETPAVPSGYTHGYQSYVTLFRPEPPTLDNMQRLHEQRDALMQRLEDIGIATRPGTHAAALVHVYREKYGLAPEGFPNAALADCLSLTLPLAVQMSDDDVDIVADELRKAFR